MASQTFFSEQQTQKDKIKALKRACQAHVKLTKEASQGLGQDRYANCKYT